MISRNALLSLRMDLEAGKDVWVTTDAETTKITDILGVEDESHMVAMAEDIKVWIAMDRIVSVEITDPEEDTLL
jgi:hypothetical protein